MAELIDVVKAITNKRHQWIDISESDKEKFFFIINRMLSRLYPEMAQNLNNKNIEKSIQLDIWFKFLEGKPYFNMWPKKLKQGELSTPDRNIIKKNLDINDDDVDYLNRFYKKELLQEVKNLKK